MSILVIYLKVRERTGDKSERMMTRVRNGKKKKKKNTNVGITTGNMT